MKQWIARIQLVKVEAQTVRVRVTVRNRYLRETHSETNWPLNSRVGLLLQERGKPLWVLLRARRSRQVDFVREVEPQSW
jgi:hypothetical protein